MEGEVWRGKWKKTANISTLLLLCLLAPSFSAPPNPSEKTPVGQPSSSHGNQTRVCPEGDYRNPSGICCLRCQPGMKLAGHCEFEGGRTNCVKCGPGTYLELSNYARNCMRCVSCGDHEEEVSKCIPKKNRECRCIKGYYRQVIDSQTWECLECKKTCEGGKVLLKECTPEADTECGCGKSFYNFNNECRPCNTCTEAEDCQILCNFVTTEDSKQETHPDGSNEFMWPVMFACGMLFAAVVIMAAMLCWKWKMQNAGSLSSTEIGSQASEKSTQKLIYNIECPNREVDEAVLSYPILSHSPENELLNPKPDCVPKEIKINQLIYSVLDAVPVPYVKRLARSLGVSERDIELAREDHHNSKEAHYQMFRVWAEGGSMASGGGGEGGGRGGGVLSLPMLQELLEKLRNLNLDGIAEELEMTYGIL